MPLGCDIYPWAYVSDAGEKEREREEFTPFQPHVDGNRDR